MRNRRNNNTKSIKDYMIPIIALIFIFTLVYFIFSGGDEVESTPNTPIDGISDNSLQVTFGGIDTEAEIINNTSNKKTIIETGGVINPGESIRVESGDISFDVIGTSKFSLDTRGEINYLDNLGLKLESSSLWIETNSDYNISMKYASIDASENSIINLDQNEVSSTIYLLKGKVQVTTLGGKTTFLSPGEKIKISNQDSLREDLDIELLKKDFENIFKKSDWYLKNNTSGYIISDINDITSTGSLVEEDVKFESISGLLNFNNIYDEGSVNSSSTNVSGTFADTRISKIIIDNKKANINIDNKTFNVLSVDTSNKSNDIIIKVFDEEENLLSKYIYTLYYSNSNSSNNSTNNTDGFSNINSESYPVNASDFLISIPTVVNGETYSSENTFFGTVKNPDVASVTVNGYTLKTYNGKIFRYHAYERFNTLGEGINNYEVKYLGSDGKVILKKYITINKKTKTSTPVKETISEPIKNISGEASVQ